MKSAAVKRPRVMPFFAEAALPVSVRGPVLDFALEMLAAICAGVDMWFVLSTGMFPGYRIGMRGWGWTLGWL